MLYHTKTCGQIAYSINRGFQQKPPLVLLSRCMSILGICFVFGGLHSRICDYTLLTNNRLPSLAGKHGVSRRWLGPDVWYCLAGAGLVTRPADVVTAKGISASKRGSLLTHGPVGGSVTRPPRYPPLYNTYVFLNCPYSWIYSHIWSLGCLNNSSDFTYVLFA